MARPPAVSRTGLGPEASKASPTGLASNGAGDGIRTRDSQHGKLVLYQLSYSRAGPLNYSVGMGCQGRPVHFSAPGEGAWGIVWWRARGEATWIRHLPGVPMAAAFESIRPGRAFAALVVGSASALFLQGVVLRVWPTPLLETPGLDNWRVAGVVLSACLCLVAAAPSKSVRRLGGEPVVVLAALSLLGVWGGSLLPASELLVLEARRTPPMEDLCYLLAELGRLFGPPVLVLAALPAAFALRALWERRAMARLHAAAAISLVALIAWLLHHRVSLLQQARELAVDHATGQIGALSWSSVGWSLLGLALVLVSGAALVKLGRWPAAAAWGLMLVPFHDVVPGFVARVHRTQAEPSSLSESAGPGLGSPVPLLDLSRQAPRYDGGAVTGTLEERLVAEGYGHMGPRFLRSKFPDDPWDWQLLRAIRLVPPPDARCAELTPTVELLMDYGVAIWLWPGRAPEPVPGPLAPALEQPVVPLLWHHAPTAASGGAPCYEIRMDKALAWVSESATGDTSRGYVIPEELEELGATLAPCDGELLVEPGGDTPTTSLFLLLDRLAGTHPQAHFYHRTSLRWPGMESYGVLAL